MCRGGRRPDQAGAARAGPSEQRAPQRSAARQSRSGGPKNNAKETTSRIVFFLAPPSIVHEHFWDPPLVTGSLLGPFALKVNNGFLGIFCPFFSLLKVFSSNFNALHRRHIRNALFMVLLSNRINDFPMIE